MTSEIFSLRSEVISKNLSPGLSKVWIVVYLSQSKEYQTQEQFISSSVCSINLYFIYTQFFLKVIWGHSSRSELIDKNFLSGNRLLTRIQLIHLNRKYSKSISMYLNLGQMISLQQTIMVSNSFLPLLQFLSCSSSVFWSLRSWKTTRSWTRSGVLKSIWNHCTLISVDSL